MSIDQSTEEKIKGSARIIFMQKGYAATKTRDIAEHAGINLALVNYYFRSKEKLFQQIMLETMQGFFSNIVKVIFDENTSLEEKLKLLASNYIDMLTEQPNMPLFIMNELQSEPDKLVHIIANEIRIRDSVFFRQLSENLGKDKMKKINPAHLFMNLMGLIVFPFIAKPLLMTTTGIKKENFNSLMNERKKLIPLWVMNMLK